MSQQKSHTIICLSSQNWDDGMWTNKQHIMSRLARHHRVIHVDFGLRPLPAYLYRRFRHRPADLLHPMRIMSDGVARRGESLYVADSYNPFWVGLLPRQNRLRDFASYDLKTLFLKRFLARHDIEDPIVWVYHPGYAEAVERLPRKLLVYDCVDNYAAFPTYRDDADWLMAREEKLCKEADLVFTTSQALYEDRAPYNPENTHLVHNVGDAEHFEKALLPETTVAPELRDLEGPVIGFVGAVSDYKLDTSWLLHAAEARPNWNFVVIGPQGRADPSTDVSKLEATPNIHLLGRRDYDVLPSYHKGFDVAVIPYRINSYTRSVFPIKFFEFLAAGNPVVISKLPALEEFYDRVLVADDARDFVRRLDEALAMGEEGRNERVELAGKYSWEKRISTLMGHIDDKLSQRAALSG